MLILLSFIKVATDWKSHIQTIFVCLGHKKDLKPESH